MDEGVTVESVSSVLGWLWPPIAAAVAWLARRVAVLEARIIELDRAKDAAEQAHAKCIGALEALRQSLGLPATLALMALSLTGCSAGPQAPLTASPVNISVSVSAADGGTVESDVYIDRSAANAEPRTTGNDNRGLRVDPRTSVPVPARKGDGLSRGGEDTNDNTRGQVRNGKEASEADREEGAEADREEADREEAHLERPEEAREEEARRLAGHGSARRRGPGKPHGDRPRSVGVPSGRSCAVENSALTLRRASGSLTRPPTFPYAET